MGLLGWSTGWKNSFAQRTQDRKSTRLNSSHANISYAVFPTVFSFLCVHDALPIRIVDQFQCDVDSGWDYSAGQRVGRIVSRKERKERPRLSAKRRGSLCALCALCATQFLGGREEIFRAKNAKGAKKTTNTTNHWDTLAGEMEQRVLPRAAGGWWISS